MRKDRCAASRSTARDVRGTMDAVWAEFIQVKKPLRSGAGFADRWRITLTTQLDDLLRTSQTSCYWLIGAVGQIVVVPAKVPVAPRVASACAASRAAKEPEDNVNRSRVLDDAAA